MRPDCIHSYRGLRESCKKNFYSHNYEQIQSQLKVKHQSQRSDIKVSAWACMCVAFKIYFARFPQTSVVCCTNQLYQKLCILAGTCLVNTIDWVLGIYVPILKNW